MKCIVIPLALLLAIGCSTVPEKNEDDLRQEIDEAVAEALEDNARQVARCDTETYKLTLCRDSRCKKTYLAQLPITGKFVLESHLATVIDEWDSGSRHFPKNSSEDIIPHVSRSCTLLKVVMPSADCEKAYASKWVRVWTPPEGGKAGQGSTGNYKPTVLQEMFTCNLMWHPKSKPLPGEKWLASAGGKSVVVVMGFETGPGDTSTFAGGCQGEVFHALGLAGGDVLTLSRLMNQTLNPGPVSCE